ncbi:hypothetical protein BST63_06345 [Bradyrhizobium canariense]|uniref:Uncharacterized protein n=1 Tax=Bradyrhizobium canariense TaxID=255045 RepID=A0ABX3X9A1_9BRAD|nr:hypothetical protein BST63_06345 [Bradyrhizobium canariense]
MVHHHCYGIIALGFVGLALKDIPITALSNATPIIQVAILSVYISCWAYGTSIDKKIQGGIYADDPQEDVSGPDQLLLSPFSRLFQSFCVLNEMEEKFTLEPAIGRERSRKPRGRRRRSSR